ncbi:hypothetical protein IWZ01DRAFT_516402 [Phyllosticta capitalensis]
MVVPLVGRKTPAHVTSVMRSTNHTIRRAASVNHLSLSDKKRDTMILDLKSQTLGDTQISKILNHDGGNYHSKTIGTRYRRIRLAKMAHNDEPLELNKMYWTERSERCADSDLVLVSRPQSHGTFPHFSPQSRGFSEAWSTTTKSAGSSPTPTSAPSTSTATPSTRRAPRPRSTTWSACRLWRPTSWCLS